MPTGMHQTAAWAAAGRGRCWHTTSAGAAPGALLGPRSAAAAARRPAARPRRGRPARPALYDPKNSPQNVLVYTVSVSALSRKFFHKCTAYLRGQPGRLVQHEQRLVAEQHALAQLRRQRAHAVALRSLCRRRAHSLCHPHFRRVSHRGGPRPRRPPPRQLSVVAHAAVSGRAHMRLSAGERRQGQRLPVAGQRARAACRRWCPPASHTPRAQHVSMRRPAPDASQQRLRTRAPPPNTSYMTH